MKSPQSCPENNPLVFQSVMVPISGSLAKAFIVEMDSFISALIAPSFIYLAAFAHP